MRILLIADLHIGSIKDIPYVYRVVTDIIEKEVIFNKTGMIVFLGDYFDKLFKVNEEFVSLAINIMSYIIDSCQRCNTKVRMIYGTESHEMNQYKIFNYHVISSNVDFKIIDSVTEENVDGCSILYIPEEYINDKHKYYSKYFSSKKHYDYIFGHGIIEDGMPAIVSFSSDSNKNKEKQVPRFKSGELSLISKLCIFGHYHCHTDMHNGVYYLGSLFRDSFGEEEPKGYGIIEDGKFIFVENTEAYIYKTYEFGPNSDIYNSPENILNEIKRIKEENERVFNGDNNGKIRLLFKAPDSLDPTFKENLKSLISNDSSVVSLIKERNTDIIDDMKEDIEDEWEYLLDSSLLLEDKLLRWINTENNVSWNKDRLMKYIGKYIKALSDREKIADEEDE